MTERLDTPFAGPRVAPPPGECSPLQRRRSQLGATAPKLDGGGSGGGRGHTRQRSNEGVPARRSMEAPRRSGEYDTSVQRRSMESHQPLLRRSGDFSSTDPTTMALRRRSVELASNGLSRRSMDSPATVRRASNLSLVDLSRSTESLNTLLSQQPSGDAVLAAGIHRHRMRRSLKTLDSCVMYTDVAELPRASSHGQLNLADERVCPFDPLPDVSGRRPSRASVELTATDFENSRLDRPKLAPIRGKKGDSPLRCAMSVSTPNLTALDSEDEDSLTSRSRPSRGSDGTSAAPERSKNDDDDDDIDDDDNDDLAEGRSHSLEMTGDASLLRHLSISVHSDDASDDDGGGGGGGGGGNPV
eukprot:m.322014 g.322014  ORF g.322014 m.322014 type:complete len:358 (-) comp26244_c0_seq1:47-1120(-)